MQRLPPQTIVAAADVQVVWKEEDHGFYG